MTQDLFIDPSQSFEKVAAEVALPEDPNSWPNEILQELFKQVPYISDFEPHVVMDRVDAERGYAFGHVEVMNKTEMQRGMNPESLMAAGIKQARIPVIVRDRKLQSFDVLVTENSRVVPLTEARLRTAVFRPQAFDVTSLTPGDTSMVGQLYPPFRQGMGGGIGGGGLSMGMGKQGSAKCCAKCGKEKCACMGKEASLLAAILPTIEPETYSTLFDRLGEDQLQAAFLKNASATFRVLGLLSKYEPVDPVKVAAAMYGSLSADVVQLTKIATGYHAKAANHAFWAPMDRVLDRGEAVKAFGEKIVLAADMHGTVTMAEGAGEEVPEGMLDESMGQPIAEFGTYRVQDEKGRKLVGFVFPHLTDVDGTVLPMMLFTNGSQAALQGEMVGEKVSDEIVSLDEGHPRGYGIFWGVLNGEHVATVPMDIQGSLGGEGGVSFVAHTIDGKQADVKIQPNIQEVMAVDGSLLLPSEMHWLPLDEAETVQIHGNAEAAEKTAHPTTAFGTVTIRSGGEDSFSFDGPPVEKLAYRHTSFLSFDDATFLLAGFGISPKAAETKLAQAWGHSAPVDVRVNRFIKTAKEQIQPAEKKASALRDLVHELRTDLLKEASVIPDPVAVDTVLSLGFINPENLGTFIGYLPLIDEAQSRMCELLVASRLGLQDVPTSALEKAVRATEDVLEGLKVLAFQKN